MQNREKKLLYGLVAALAVWGALYGFREKLSRPVSERQAEIAALRERLDAREDEQLRILEAARSLARWKEQSLPPDPLDAQRLYQEWLTRLAQAAGLADVKVTPGRRVPRSKLYVAVQVSIEGKASLERLARFLYWFERTDLLHRIGQLDVESDKNTGDPELTVSLIAEGLSLSGAKPRGRLFPETRLAADVSSGATAITVTSAAGFPKSGPFHVRIGDEFLTVTEVDGKTWKVRGGIEEDRDSTAQRVGRRAAGEVVELAPLVSPAQGRTLADFRRDLVVAGKSPFVLPEPKAASPSSSPAEDPARKTYLIATIVEGSQRTAWLYDETKQTNTILAEGDSFKVAEIEGTLDTIGEGFIRFRSRAGAWRLALGENLREMQKTAALQNEPASTATAAGSGGDARRELLSTP